ncbi:hypothetical protein VTO42DRAFT_4092 [Malbranchea cinnamomea]
MSRPVFLLVFPSPLFPAHWSLFVPCSPDHDEAVGTRIHVTGDARSGFAHEFVRNYDIRQSTQGDRLVRLGEADERYISPSTASLTGSRGPSSTRVSNETTTTEDTPTTPATVPDRATESRDVDATNELERIALRVPAPGPSLNSVQKQPSGRRVEIQNCQTWLRQLVAAYVDRGILGPEALAAVDQAPRH